MTAYHGGKQRLGKKLAEIIVNISLDIAEEEDFNIKGYCEPFCGMLGVYRYIPEMFEGEDLYNLRYVAGDTNESVIKMWKSAKKGWKPPTKTTEKEYTKLKNSKNSSALKGYIGHQYSYGGSWFNGYAPKYGKTIDSSKASEKIQHISKCLNDVKFTYGDYQQFTRLKGFIIYCDPPYVNTNDKYISNNFEINEFWNWCNYMSQTNIIFVSSYQAPKGIQTIFESSHLLTGGQKMKSKKRIEKLYLL